MTCDDDIDECNTSLVTCPAQSECVNTAGSYACLCLTGFVKNSTGLCAGECIYLVRILNNKVPEVIIS